MDEPFGALDAQTREEMQELLLLLSHVEHATVLFVTHDIDEAIYLADRILVLSSHPGRLIREIESPFDRERTLEVKLEPRFLELKRELIGLIDTSDGADALVGGKEVAKVEDLKGKKVAVTLGECNEVLLIKAIESAGMSKEDVELVNMDPDAAGAALKAGNVDAAVTWEPWITQLIGQEDANVLFSTKDAPNILLDVVAVPTENEKTDETKAFLAALDKATKMVEADPKKAAEMVSEKLEVPADEIVDMLGKVTLYDSAESVTQMSGETLEAGKDLAAFFEESGSIQEKPDVKALFDSSLLHN